MQLNTNRNIKLVFDAFPNQPILETILPEQTLTSIVIYPLYHHVTGSTIHQGEIN